MLRTVQRNADKWDYILEAEAINIIATGFKAQDIRNFVGCKDNITRDSLTAIYNEYLMKLQEWDICLHKAPLSVFSIIDRLFAQSIVK
mgnify:CR=1 FL=1